VSDEHGADGWERTRALFHELLESPEAGRAARLASATEGEPALRAELESLLASHAASERSGSFGGATRGVDGWLDPPPERVGPYRVLRRLGAGGMGEVWLAEDTRLGRRVALKQLPAARREDAEARGRLLREARAAACLNHPHIATIYEVAEYDGRDTIAFEHVDGRTLAARLTEGALPFDELLRVALPLAQALAAAHAQGVVHRDLKPSNVMLDAAQRPKLVDFGLAKQAATAPDAAAGVDPGAATGPGAQAARDSVASNASAPLGDTSLTAHGAVFGTPAAMSPEQVRGQGVDARSDVFAFGALLYEMACGQAPFRGANAVEVMGAVLHLDPEPLAARCPALPARFTRLVERALAKPLDARVQSMDELVRELAALAVAPTAPASPNVDPPSAHVRDDPPDWRAAARLVVVALVLLALAAVFWSDA